MNTFSKVLVALALAAVVGSANAQQVSITLSLPAVLPTLVVVQPGVSVVPDMDVEVFYSGGYYWTRRDAGWYRTHDHKGSWAHVDDRYVPVAIAKSPPGQYKHYKGSGKGKSDKHDDKDKKDKKGSGHD